MRNKNLTTLKTIAIGSMFAMAVLAPSRNALAQGAPRSFVASPDIYKVIGETEHYRVIAGTWKSGQRDQWHSHSLAGVYYVTDCHLRGYSPNGSSQEGSTKAGTRGVNNPVASQSVENIGQSECKLVLIEQR